MLSKLADYIYIGMVPILWSVIYALGITLLVFLSGSPFYVGFLVGAIVIVAFLLGVTVRDRI